jgi:glycosyltransferase involved in cell wall biosynthesis
MYRFGFILSTALSNATRYRTLRKFAERDKEVECTWAPVSHYFPPDEPDPVALVPRPFYKRAVVINQAWPVLSRMLSFDAVMVHQLEPLFLAALRSLVWRRPPVVSAHDSPPMIDPDNYPLYPEDRAKPQWRRSLRLAADLWTARHTPYFITCSQWQSGVLVKNCEIEASRVKFIPFGLDLEKWPEVARDTAASSGPVRLLFVASEFERKGGPELLELFANGLFPRMTLDLVTPKPPLTVPEGVVVHDNLVAGDGRIQRLYANADIFLLPTTADVSSYVCLEAAACSCPIIASSIGGIPDMVRSGCNGLLFKAGNMTELREAIETLAADPIKRATMGANGRRIIESDFDASRNVPKILEVMKGIARTASEKI